MAKYRLEEQLVLEGQSKAKVVGICPHVKECWGEPQGEGK